MPPPPPDAPRCLVTGASSGLGRAIAEALALDGARVIATGRDTSRLDALARDLESRGVPAGRVVVVPADLTVEADRERLFDEAARRYDGALDLLVQSAGVGAYGRFSSHAPGDLRRVFEINVFAVVEAARLAYPLLRVGKRPAMVVIGSIVARRALPGRSEYSASKHAVAAFADAVRAEWTRDGIHVLVVNPGFTRTDFDRNLVVDTAIYKVADRRTMDAATVARRTLRALARRRNEATFSFSGRALLAFNRLLPRFVDWGLGRWTRRLYADPLAMEQAESGARLPREPRPPVAAEPPAE